MSADLTQVFLNAKQCSGRGVRIRALPPGEHNALILKVGTLAGKDATMGELQLSEFREGVKSMLVSVTQQSGLKGDDALQAEGITWVDLDPGKLDMPGPYNMDSLFTAKDQQVLQAIYRRLHTTTIDEVEVMMGKAVAVSVD